MFVTLLIKGGAHTLGSIHVNIKFWGVMIQIGLILVLKLRISLSWPEQRLLQYIYTDIYLL